MNENLRDVQQDIKRTRAAMGEKIALLKNKIEQKTKMTLNPAYHARTRPLQSLGALVAGGWLLRRLIKKVWRRPHDSY